jgi:hypothetical protein
MAKHAAQTALPAKKRLPTPLSGATPLSRARLAKEAALWGQGTVSPGTPAEALSRMDSIVR